MHAPSETCKSCWTEELFCFHNTLVAQIAACTRVISVAPCATTETYNSYCVFYGYGVEITRLDALHWEEKSGVLSQVAPVV